MVKEFKGLVELQGLYLSYTFTEKPRLEMIKKYLPENVLLGRADRIGGIVESSPKRNALKVRASGISSTNARISRLFGESKAGPAAVGDHRRSLRLFEPERESIRERVHGAHSLRQVALGQNQNRPVDGVHLRETGESKISCAPSPE